MNPLSIEEILPVIEGKLICGSNCEFKNVCINSNDVKKNSLFVPIKGKKVDAHDFIDSAFENGAVVSLTEKDLLKRENGALIKVRDSVEALQNLAEFYRLKFNLPIIGVTGSVGKTTTKEMISCAMSQQFKVMKTSGNLNGQIGVPLTLFNLDDTYDAAVIEMGVSMFEEMGKIAKIARPNIAVINNIGMSHLENFHTRENILKEKLHIADFIDQDGKLFFNGDDEILEKSDIRKYNSVSFGFSTECDCRASDVKFIDGKTYFRFLYKDINEEFQIPTIGVHNIYNALASILIAMELNVDVDKISKGLQNYKNIGMRQEIHKLNNMTVIDDSYNASPDSMKSSIDVLRTISDGKTSIAVLADMLELGSDTKQKHIEIGKYLAHAGINKLITIGSLAKYIAYGFGKISDTESFDTNQEAIDYLLRNKTDGCYILVKGSRGMRTDEIVKKLLEEK